MNDAKTTRKANERIGAFGKQEEKPALLFAYSPPFLSTLDHCPIVTPFTIGRSDDCDLVIEDEEVSKRHVCITKKAETFRIEDLNSTNGTYVNGERLSGRMPLYRPAVIRFAQVVSVFHSNARFLNDPPLSEDFVISGRFHTRTLLQEISEASLSRRHILLIGPSGTGKELSANAFAQMVGNLDKSLPYVVHNAASFTSEEEAKTTIFGVGKGVFTGVDARKGLLEQANGGVLFLDEVHNLSQNVQRSLLRVIEEDRMSRIGEEQKRPIHVRLVLSSNAPGSSYGLADDLLARLRTIQIPPLSDRLADIPTIFNTLLVQSLTYHGISENDILPLLNADHYETLCLDAFPKDNVRGLVDLSDRISTKIKSGMQPIQAIAQVFQQRFRNGPLANRHRTDSDQVNSNSHYQRNRELIISTYHQCGGNISETMRRLNSQSVRCSRPWLTKFLRDWGVHD